MPWFVVRPEGQPVPMAYSFTYVTPAVDSPSARAFRKAAVDHLKRVNPGPRLCFARDRLAADARRRSAAA